MQTWDMGADGKLHESRARSWKLQNLKRKMVNDHHTKSTRDKICVLSKKEKKNKSQTSARGFKLVRPSLGRAHVALSGGGRQVLLAPRRRLVTFLLQVQFTVTHLFHESHELHRHRA